MFITREKYFVCYIGLHIFRLLTDVRCCGGFQRSSITTANKFKVKIIFEISVMNSYISKRTTLPTFYRYAYWSSKSK